MLYWISSTHHHASHNPNEFLRNISSLCDECSEDWQASSLLGLPKGGVFTERLSRLKALFAFVSYTYVCARTHRHMDTLPRTSLHYTCINLLADKGESSKPLFQLHLPCLPKPFGSYIKFNLFQWMVFIIFLHMHINPQRYINPLFMF